MIKVQFEYTANKYTTYTVHAKCSYFSGYKPRNLEVDILDSNGDHANIPDKALVQEIEELAIMELEVKQEEIEELDFGGNGYGD